MKIEGPIEYSQVKFDDNSTLEVKAYTCQLNPHICAVEFAKRYFPCLIESGRGLELGEWSSPDVAMRVALRFMRLVPEPLKSQLTKKNIRLDDAYKDAYERCARECVIWGHQLQSRHLAILAASTEAMTR